MPRALRVCSKVGCPNLVPAGRCDDCTRAGRKVSDQKRGTSAERGYNSATWRTQRAACLRRDVLCQCHDTGHGHGNVCVAAATVADHWPDSRRELLAARVPDPDAVSRLRGICAPCHNKRTAVDQPGGWNQR